MHAVRPKERVRILFSEWREAVSDRSDVWFKLQKEAVGARWKQAAGGDPGDPFLADIYVYSASN